MSLCTANNNFKLKHNQQLKPHNTAPYRDNLKHLLAWDVAIAVEVVHTERPLQLLFQSATRRHTQRTDELAEVNRSVAVCIKSPEYVLRKPRCIAIRKEVAINLLELLHSQVSGRTILHDTGYVRNSLQVKVSRKLTITSSHHRSNSYPKNPWNARGRLSSQYAVIMPNCNVKSIR